MSKGKNYFLNGKERFAIYELLRAHVKYVEGMENVVEFEDGWDDQRIAKEVSEKFSQPGINDNHVKRLRQEAMGELKRGGRQVGVTTHSRVDRLEAKVLATIAAFNRLAEKLGEPGLRIEL